MQRLAASRAGAAGGARLRALSTQSGGNAQGEQPRIVKAGIGRWLFVGLLGGGGAVAAYRMHANDEFRALVEQTVPGATEMLARVTGADYAAGSGVVKSVSTPTSTGEKKKKWSEGSTLPEHFDSVSDILAKAGAKEGKTTEEEADTNATMKMPTDDGSAKNVEESKIPATATEDVGKLEKKSAEMTSKVADVSKGSTETVVMSVTTTQTAPRPTVDLKSQKTSKDDAPSKSASKPKSGIPESLGPKAKLQRVFGVPGDDGPKSPFEKPNYVYDPSVYMLPKPKETSVPIDPAVELAHAEQVMAEVEALRKDLEDHAQWDALRLQKAVYAQLLEDKKVAAKESAEVARRHAGAMQKVKDEALKHHEVALEAKTRQLAAEAEARRDAEVAALLLEREKALRAELELAYRERELKASAVREEALHDAKVQLEAMTARFDELVAFNAASREAAGAASAAFALAERAGTDQPFADALDAVARRSELAAAVAASIPREAAERGVATTAQLREAFGRVGRRALDASMVPDEAAGTLWAHFLAVVMARLKISRFELLAASADHEAPRDDEERVRMARTLVAKGDLVGAVSVLEKVEKKLAKSVLEDWVRSARDRCTVDKAKKVLFADASIAQIALATTPPVHPGATQ